MIKPENVHLRFTNKNGVDIYGIGVWSESDAQYTAPLDAETRRATGCHSEFSKNPIGAMSLKTAKSEARKLYGYVNIDNS